MDRTTYVETLRAAADELGRPCSAELAERLADHQALVDKWARRINLTTVTDPRAAAVRHGLDCLLFGALLPESEPGPTVDVGSGGGFPGLILAIAQPSRRMILLEPIRKRTSFLRAATAELGLDNVRVVEGRLEANRPARGVPWPVPSIVSRATVPPLDLVPLAAPYLAPGGALVLTGGAGAPEPEALEAAATAAGLRVEARQSFSLPGGLTRVLDRLVRPAEAAPEASD